MHLIPPKSPLWPDGTCDLERRVAASSILEAWGRQGLDLTMELGGIESIGLWRCRESQLQFYSPTAVGGERLYQFIARQAWYYARSKWEFTKAAELLQAVGSKTILEVGCGAGAFLETARDVGLVARGIDFNTTAVQQARDRGLKASADSLADVMATGERFSAVCAFQVLEHLDRPREFVEQAVALVEPGGHLIFCTPDGDGWLGRRLQLLDMPPHHATRWGRAAFAFLPRLFPLELVSLLSEPLSPQHYAAWAAALVDPDPVVADANLELPRRLSVRNRILVAVMRELRRLACIPQADGGQSLMAIYRRR